MHGGKYKCLIILKFAYKPGKNPRQKLDYMSFDTDFLHLSKPHSNDHTAS